MCNVGLTDCIKVDEKVMIERKIMVEPMSIGVLEGVINYSTVWVDGKCGIVDDKGIVVIKPKYNRIGRFHKGLAGVKLNDKYGLINKKGVEVVKPKYDSLELITNDLMIYGYKDKLGLLDMNCKEITDCKYNSFLYNDGFIIASIGDLQGILNCNGKEITEVKYECFYTFEKDILEAKVGHDYVFINRYGKEFKTIENARLSLK